MISLRPWSLTAVLLVGLGCTPTAPSASDAGTGTRTDGGRTCVVAGRTGITSCETSASGSCPPGQFCDAVMLTCSVGCTSDANCPGDELCIRELGAAVGVCAPCMRCGDGRCDSGESCPADCGSPARCGDGLCNGEETNGSCPADCPATPRCGDGTCNGAEDPSSCPLDCGAPARCGDGLCNGGETTASCPGDCPPPVVCGDGVCGGSENALSCPADCDDGSEQCFRDCTDFAFFDCIPSAAPCTAACNGATPAQRRSFTSCTNVVVCETYDGCIGLLGG